MMCFKFSFVHIFLCLLLVASTPLTLNAPPVLWGHVSFPLIYLYRGYNSLPHSPTQPLTLSLVRRRGTEDVMPSSLNNWTKKGSSRWKPWCSWVTILSKAIKHCNRSESFASRRVPSDKITFLLIFILGSWYSGNWGKHKNILKR